MKALLALLKAICIYSLLIWLYVVASVLNPETAPAQYLDLSRYVPIPTDMVGVIGFGVSFVAYFLWSWLASKQNV